jgi:hypothetical protein
MSPNPLEAEVAVVIARTTVAARLSRQEFGPAAASWSIRDTAR